MDQIITIGVKITCGMMGIRSIRVQWLAGMVSILTARISILTAGIYMRMTYCGDVIVMASRQNVELGFSDSIVAKNGI